MSSSEDEQADAVSGPEESGDSETESQNGETEQNRETIRSELKSMTFEELLKLKEELGSKTYNEAVFGEDSTKRKRKAKTKFVRENKNRPREVSAKKQVPLLGKPSGSKKLSASQARDPRFDEKCGEFDRDQFKANYSFVNDIRENELAELKKQLKKLPKNEVDEKQKIKLLIQRMENQFREAQKLQARKQAQAEDKQKNRKAIHDEKRPFFVSKGEQKVKDLVQKFEELKKTGKLNKHLEKRRKKNISRDRKKYNFE